MTTDDITGDELASAYLDGEATPDEVALVESSPALLARVDQFRAVARAVSTPVTSPAQRVRAAAIRAALSPAGDPVLPGAGIPASLDEARARRARRWLPALGAAAAVVAILAAGSAVVRSDGGRGDLSAASLTTTAADESGAGQGGGQAEEGATTAAPAVGGADAMALAAFDADLGSFDSLADLEAAVDGRLAERLSAEADGAAPSTTAAAGGAANEYRSSVPCLGAVIDRDVDLGTFVYAAPAVYRDEPVIVLLFDLAVGGQRLYVVDPGSCNALSRLDR